MISGPGGDVSSLAQNLGIGQKECPDRNILGPGRGLRNRGKGHV